MNKFRTVKSLLMNLPVSLTMTFVAQWVNIRQGHMAHFDWGSAAVSFCFSYFIAFLIAYLIPTERWGFAFAEKCGAKKGTWGFDILVNLVVNTIFCVIRHHTSVLASVKRYEAEDLTLRAGWKLQKRGAEAPPLFSAV